MAGFFKDNPAVTADAYTQDALTSKNEAEAAKVAAEAAKVAAEAAKLAAETAEANAETAETNAETAEANAETAANGISADAATATTKAGEAAASATNAAGSATTASTKAGEAATSATNAAGSATSATTSAATATTQAGNASASATAASSSASSAASAQSAAETAKTAAEAAKSAAETAETNAASSQSAAATSASNASSSESNSAASASSSATFATLAGQNKVLAEAAKTAAETAKTNAETAETNAETAETNAAASASAASTSASNAATSATSASNSATAASSSESNVSSSATAAATSATNAATSASNAASSAASASNSAATATTQASTSTTQAGNSASSATAASNSASSAASAQSAAEAARDSALAALDSFDDRYLGSKSSAPTVDNDGNALVSGALYFDSTSSAMKVYDGSQWLNAYASLAGALIANQNLSDLNNAATARTNLGLGTAATTAASDYATAAQADQTVSLTGAGATSISGTYPNFTITSTDTNTNTTYSAGSGISLSGTTFSNSAPDQTVSLTGAGATSISGTYPNFTITSTDTNTDTNTTYSAGSGITLTGTTFSNAAPDQTVSLTGAGATSISGTYPNFTITSNNTEYSVGDGGLTQNNFTNALKNKLDGIEASADVTDTANVVSALTAGTNVTIASDGTISSTDTNTDTTYSAGSGISLSGTTFSNSAPDQTVALTGSGGTTVSGTYPNFTISSAASIDGTTINPSNIKISGAQGTDGQVLTSTGSGVAWEDSGNNSFIVNTFTANGSTTAFTLSTSPSSESNLMVFIEGVYQNPSDFTLSGTTLTLDAAPPSGRKIVAYQVTEVEMDVISDNAVGISQLNVSDGSSGQVLQTDGSGTLSFGDVGSLPPNIAGVSSGRYYSGMMHAKAASSFNLSTTSVQYWPFIVPEDCTIDELTVIINGGTGNSGDVAQIAVYGPMPSTVGSTPHKITTSTFAVDSGYGKSVAITATSFTAGIYFFAMVANTSSLSVRAFEDMEEHINYMVGVNNYSFNGGLGRSQNAVNTVSTWPHTFLTSVSPSAATHSFGNRPQFKYGVQ